MNDTTAEEKKILFHEISNYIKENCYNRDGSVKYDGVWLVGWIAEEFQDRRNAMKVLIENEYGLLGNLLYKLARTPDAAITQFIEETDTQILIKVIDNYRWKSELCADPYAMRLLLKYDTKYAEELSKELLKSKTFLLSVVGFYPEVIRRVFQGMFKDVDFVWSLIREDYVCLR